MLGAEANSQADATYRPAFGWFAGIYLAMAGFFLALGLPLLIGGLVSGEPVLDAFGGVVTVFALAFGSLIRLLRRPVRLSPTLLTIPRGRSPLAIPVADIAGVGLVFKQTVPPNRAPPIGWYLTVWRQDGSSERTAISWLPTRYRKGTGESAKLSLSASGFDPVTGTDRSALEESQAAHVARDLYTRILALQGAGGPLATKALERHPDAARFSVSPITAWWSPSDGELGRPSG